MAYHSVSSEVFTEINEQLEKLENDNNITILYACESGSRAWGFHSPESDYDIRFIYIQNDPDHYFNFEKPTSSINSFSDNRKYDWEGWDIRKAIGHLQESNCSLIEWISSPVVYKDINGLSTDMRNAVSHMHTATSLCFHYMTMALNNWEDWMDGKDIVLTKKYMYIIRPACMLHWLMVFPDKPLVINYFQILDELEVHVDPIVIANIRELLEHKMTSKHMGENPRNKIIDKYVNETIQQFRNMTGKQPKDINIQGIISLHKKMCNQVKTLRAILEKRGQVNRTEYLSILGVCFQFIWLQQHPDYNKKHIPDRLGQLLQEIEIPENIRKQSAQIIMNSVKTIDLTAAKESDHIKRHMHDIQKIPEAERLVSTVSWRRIFTSVLCDYYREIYVASNPDSHKDFNPLQLDLHTNVLKFITESNEPLPREDMIEFWLKKMIPEFIWLLENQDEKIGRIPEQVYTKIYSYPTEFAGLVKRAVEESHTSYYLAYPDIHVWVEELIYSNKEYVKETAHKLEQLRIKQKENRYCNSIKKIDKSIFKNIFTKQYYQIHSK